MNRLFVIFAALALAVGARSADASISYGGGTFFENFNSLPAHGAATVPLSGTVGLPNPLPGTTGFVGTKTGGTGTTLNLITDNGSSNSGALHNLGPDGTLGTDPTERALGELSSGTTITTFGVEIINNTGSALPSLTLSAFSEQWRSSTSSAVPPTNNIMVFAYALSGGAVTAANFLTDATLTALASLDLVGEAPVTTNAATDGNSAPFRDAISGMIPGPIAAGASVFVRWTDVNDLGNDASLALDDLSIVPEPASMALMLIGGLVALRRRR